ncbi:AbrB/MazE/SpoVT family DNA-binding domain-containing protein [Fibrobacterota bacterium]
MSYATLTSKGQVTIPNRIRKLLELRTGDKIEFRFSDKKNAVYIISCSRKAEEAFGTLAHRAKKAVSEEEINKKLKARFKRTGG